MPRNKYQSVTVLPPASQFGRGESIIYQGEVLTSDGVNWTSQTGPLSYDAGDLPDPALLAPGATVVVDGNPMLASPQGYSPVSSQPSNYVRFHIVGKQPPGSGNAGDSSLYGNSAILPNSAVDADVWGNPGYITSTAGTGKAPNVNPEAGAFNVLTDSFLLNLTINKAAGTVAEAIIGNGLADTFDGLVLSARGAAGTIKPVIRTSLGNVTVQEPTAVYCDGTDHLLSLAFDGKNKNMYMWRDGLLVGSWKTGMTTNTTSITRGFGIGGASSDNTSANITYAGKYKNIQFSIFENSGLPLNVGELVSKYYATPELLPKMNDYILPWKRTLLICAPGQSNESGSGERMQRTNNSGIPLSDPVAPNGVAYGSVWPSLSKEMASKGVSLDVQNSAVGGTSIVDSWCGRVRNWASGMYFVRGSYILASGGLWKSAVAAGSPKVSTTMPTGTTDFTGADGFLWTYLGAPTDTDINGAIFKRGDARFDPNGFFSSALALKNGRVGFDEMVALIQIGQTDAEMGTTQAGYYAGVVNSVEYWLAASVKVKIGFTIYGWGNGTTIETNYQTKLIPAINQALSFYAGNQNVSAGANLRTALGVLPLVTDPFSMAPGVMNYGSGRTLLGYHANDSAIKVMAKTMAEFL